jgi:hypothetical protein
MAYCLALGNKHYLKNEKDHLDNNAANDPGIPGDIIPGETMDP